MVQSLVPEKWLRFSGTCVMQICHRLFCWYQILTQHSGNDQNVVSESGTSFWSVHHDHKTVDRVVNWLVWIVFIVERPTDSSTQVRRTWGPSSLQKKDKIQHRPILSPTTNGWVRFSRSAPNLPKTLSCMGDQSVVRAFTDLGVFLMQWLVSK